MSEQRCTLCEQAKPLDEFVQDRNRPGGRTDVCRVCHSRRVAFLQREQQIARRYAIYERTLGHAPVPSRVSPGKVWDCDEDGYLVLRED